jgi:hypothetical protein
VVIFFSASYVSSKGGSEMETIALDGSSLKNKGFIDITLKILSGIL